MPTLEYFDTYRDGKCVSLWRCVDCSRSLARATGKPLEDNGFKEWPNPIQHIAACTLRTIPEKKARSQRELF